MLIQVCQFKLNRFLTRVPIPEKKTPLLWHHYTLLHKLKRHLLQSWRKTSHVLVKSYFRKKNASNKGQKVSLSHVFTLVAQMFLRPFRAFGYATVCRPMLRCRVMFSSGGTPTIGLKTIATEKIIYPFSVLLLSADMSRIDMWYFISIIFQLYIKIH